MAFTLDIGQKAPDFNAPAYYQGKFTTVKLSDYAIQNQMIGSKVAENVSVSVNIVGSNKL